MVAMSRRIAHRMWLPARQIRIGGKLFSGSQRGREPKAIEEYITPTRQPSKPSKDTFHWKRVAGLSPGKPRRRRLAQTYSSGVSTSSITVITGKLMRPGKVFGRLWIEAAHRACFFRD